MTGGVVSKNGWSFANRTQTTAEVISDLYRTIRDAAGDDVVIIGCNTISHLCAGMFELNRIGDDTSGNEWRRNPQMGVNTLAFRAPQQGSFYGADADCCPITKRLEWKKARQWLDLVSRSGTPLFVSVDRTAVTPQIRDALRDALAVASRAAPLAEPIDWMETRTPREWNLGGTRVTYDWS
jgi:alpha-galactosidase